MLVGVMRRIGFMGREMKWSKKKANFIVIGECFLDFELPRDMNLRREIK